MPVSGLGQKTTSSGTFQLVGGNARCSGSHSGAGGGRGGEGAPRRPAQTGGGAHVEKRVGWVGVSGQSSRLPLRAAGHNSSFPPASAQELKSGQTGGGVTTAGSTSGRAQQPDAQGQYGSFREEGRLGNAEPGDGEQAGTA